MSVYASLRAAAAAAAGTPMVDLSFPIAGGHLPPSYPFALESAVVAVLPWLAEDDACGIHAIRAPRTDFGLVLSRRSRLVLRIPAERAEAARRLAGQELQIDDCSLAVGIPVLRAIQPFATLQAWNVASVAEDEQGFLDDIAFQLEALGVRGKPICGRRERLDDGERRIDGFGLVLHELPAAHSLLLQSRGLGPARRLGCGVFVHHKIIEGLGDDPD